jgi:hypothetical protein
VKRLPEIEAIFVSLDEEGYSYDTFPVARMYRACIWASLRAGRTTLCLKTALKMYFILDPPQADYVDHIADINNLYLIVSLLDELPQGSSVLQELPPNVKSIASLVYLHLREKLVDCGKVRKRLL